MAEQTIHLLSSHLVVPVRQSVCVCACVMNYMALSGKQIWKQLWWFVQLVFCLPSCHSSSVQQRSDENLHKGFLFWGVSDVRRWTANQWKACYWFWRGDIKKQKIVADAEKLHEFLMTSHQLDNLLLPAALNIYNIWYSIQWKSDMKLWNSTLSDYKHIQVFSSYC